MITTREVHALLGTIKESMGSLVIFIRGKSRNVNQNQNGSSTTTTETSLYSLPVTGACDPSLRHCNTLRLTRAARDGDYHSLLRPNPSQIQPLEAVTAGVPMRDAWDWGGGGCHRVAWH